MVHVLGHVSTGVQGEGPHDAALGRLPQQTPEGDDGGHAGAVEEEEGGQTLQAECVGVVGQVVR